MSDFLMSSFLDVLTTKHHGYHDGFRARKSSTTKSSSKFDCVTRLVFELIVCNDVLDDVLWLRNKSNYHSI